MPITSDATLPATIPALSIDWPVCACGNTPRSSGFYAINRDGVEVDMTPEAWQDELMCCAECDLVITVKSFDANTFHVVGKRADHL